MSLNEEVLNFLYKHENRRGAVGEFVRCCILVAERADVLDRDELIKSDQLGYLIDCFISEDDPPCQK